MIHTPVLIGCRDADMSPLMNDPDKGESHLVWAALRCKPCQASPAASPLTGAGLEVLRPCFRSRWNTSSCPLAWTRPAGRVSGRVTVERIRPLAPALSVHSVCVCVSGLARGSRAFSGPVSGFSVFKGTLCEALCFRCRLMAASERRGSGWGGCDAD